MSNCKEVLFKNLSDAIVNMDEEVTVDLTKKVVDERKAFKGLGEKSSRPPACNLSRRNDEFSSS